MKYDIKIYYIQHKDTKCKLQFLMKFSFLAVFCFLASLALASTLSFETPEHVASLESPLEHYQSDQKIYDVIIIGAGISGIGASKVLKQNKIDHIILQSRNRYGGRIYSEDFAGIKVQMGATYIHNPTQDNKIYQFIKAQGIKTVQSSQEEQFYYQDTGLLDDDDLFSRVEQLEEQAYNQGQQVAQQSDKDISLAQSYKKFIDTTLSGEKQLIRDLVLWKLNLEGGIQGAQLSQMSAKKPSIQQQLDDLLVPGGGYPSVVQRLYKIANPSVRFNTRVLYVDYSENVIKIGTNNGVFHAKKVISSLPLGVLKAGKVKFTPQLPRSYSDAINGIGNGNMNKIFFHFNQPFWDADKGYINFVTNSKTNNRYTHGFIYPNNQGKHLLLVFAGGKASSELMKWSNHRIKQDFTNFLTKFVDNSSQYKILGVKMSRWHKQEFSLGSYCYNKVGTTKQHFQQLRKSIQNRLWFIGEHTHPTLNSYAHGAYETGLWAGKEAADSLKTTVSEGQWQSTDEQESDEE